MRSMLVGFYALQGCGVMLWWAMLLAMPGARSWFFPDGVIDAAMSAFLLPDVAVLGTGSLVTAFALHRKRAAGRPLAWLVAGAALYAMLFTAHWTVVTQAPILSLALMIVSGLGSLVCARQVV